MDMPGQMPFAQHFMRGFSGGGGAPPSSFRLGGQGASPAPSTPPAGGGSFDQLRALLTMLMAGRGGGGQGGAMPRSDSRQVLQPTQRPLSTQQVRHFPDQAPLSRPKPADPAPAAPTNWESRFVNPRQNPGNWFNGNFIDPTGGRLGGS